MFHLVVRLGEMSGLEFLACDNCTFSEPLTTLSQWLRQSWRLLPLLFFVVLFLLPGVVKAADEARHILSYPADRQQIILLRSEFPVSTPVTELILPNWTPGLTGYGILLPM